MRPSDTDFTTVRFTSSVHDSHTVPKVTCVRSRNLLHDFTTLVFCVVIRLCSSWKGKQGADKEIGAR